MYTVDGEIGRFSFQTHSVLNENEIHFNSAVDLFERLGSKEYYKTVGFKDVSMIFGTIRLSYRKATELINRIRYQQDGDGTPCRTLQEATEREGTQFLNFLKEKSERVLKKHAFNSDGHYDGDRYGGTGLKPLQHTQNDILLLQYLLQLRNFLHCWTKPLRGGKSKNSV